MTSNAFRIAVMPGDGIGIEVMDACMHVLNAVMAKVGGPGLEFQIVPGGAGHYRDEGVSLPPDTLKACDKADAILLAAMGLPEVAHAGWHRDRTTDRPAL